ncbi:hypothetical protein HYFRA_00011224 [Hymenoscyphus fraxineus]|uniref:Heterokaryon incompatibility domain-containing protein n=1 Tax=Hymenoscyphus fraxineus TaxID=746836 RepID=A0A9N9L335_9HELO|nr:hypothetical protein HYFRA_00011224 [Hymenoscyphus fraxineus]
MFCVHCKVIDLSRKSFEESTNGTGIGIHHLFLGCHSTIQARAETGCPTCKSILACCDLNTSIVVENVKDRCGLRGDYGVSIHIENVQPRLYVLLGDPPGLEAINQDPAQRRANFMRYCGFHIFSTTNIKESEDRGRLYDPGLVDKELIKSWMARCDCSHGLECRGDDAILQNLISYPRPSLSFIDVETQCIVTPNIEVQYVALSYVWGQVPSIMALKENIAQLREPGSLSLGSRNIVPQTIRDSMTLCSLINQRYLWVDRLCIVQDDLENKMASIDAMAWIYAQATLTIVAAQGTDADFGLPGIGGKHIEARAKHILPFFSGPMLKGSLWLHRTDQLERTPWSKRGWTLQENLFSRRLLIMDDIITWRCRSATWIEGLECFDERQKIERVPLLSTVEPKKGYRETKLSVPSWPSLIDFATIVHAFNTRTLTFDSDTLNAFAGTMKAMTPSFPSGFYAGLPEFYFDIALLWQAHRGLRSRFTTQVGKEGNQFPSWSWAGWMGSLRLDTWYSCFDAEVKSNKSAIKVSNMVEWFKDSSYTEKIDNAYHVSRDKFQNASPDMALPPGWKYHTDEEIKTVYYTYPSLSQTKRFNYPIYTEKQPPSLPKSPNLSCQLLYFKTSRAYFTFLSASKIDPPSRLREVKDPKTGEFNYVQDLTIINPDTSEWAGEIRITLSAKEYPEPLRNYENCELIVISKGETSIVGKDVGRHSFHEVSDQKTREIIMGNGKAESVEKAEEIYTFYFVLWIVRDADGITYRKGLGRVWEKAWEDGNEAAEIEVVLG